MKISKWNRFAHRLLINNAFGLSWGWSFIQIFIILSKIFEFKLTNLNLTNYLFFQSLNSIKFTHLFFLFLSLFVCLACLFDIIFQKLFTIYLISPYFVFFHYITSLIYKHKWELLPTFTVIIVLELFVLSILLIVFKVSFAIFYFNSSDQYVLVKTLV